MSEKNDKTMTVTGRVKHVGPSNAPRCVITDPNDKERRWVLRPGGEKSRTGLITLAKGSRLHAFVKGHKNLSFELVSEQPAVGGGNVAAAPRIKRKERNTIANVGKRYADWKKEKNATRKVNLPKPMDESSLKGPTPKQLLEAAAGMSPKQMIEKQAEKPAKPDVVEPKPEPTLSEPVSKPAPAEVSVPEPEPDIEPIEEFVLEPVNDAPAERMSDDAFCEMLESLAHEELMEAATFNGIDLGRTRTPKGALNKIYNYMDTTGLRINIPD